jgi:hypothetical protein
MKTRIYVAFATLFLLASSSAAFAATALTTDGITTSTTGPTIRGGSSSTMAQSDTQGVVLGRLSKGVKLGVQFDTAAYALTTKHDGGTNMYGTAFDSTSMFMQGGNPTLAAPDASDATAFSDGWTAM